MTTIPRHLSRVSALVLGAILVAPSLGCLPEPAPVTQPIAFNHAIHIRRRIPCTDCHVGAEKQARAGLPSLSRCLLCHVKPQGDPPSEREGIVRKLANEGFKLKWNKVTKNPGHVYFSHRMHTTVAKLDCSRCHKDVASWDKPPERGEPTLNDMGACMDCHRKNNASNQCSACHH